MSGEIFYIKNDQKLFVSLLSTVEKKKVIKKTYELATYPVCTPYMRLNVVSERKWIHYSKNTPKKQQQLKRGMEVEMNYVLLWMEGMEETNPKEIRCQTDRSSTYLDSDLLCLSYSSIKKKPVCMWEKDSMQNFAEK